MANQLNFCTRELAAPLDQEDFDSIDAFSISNVTDPTANQLDFAIRQPAFPLAQEENSSMNAFPIANTMDPMANELDSVTGQMAAPLTQDDISSINATRIETAMQMVSSLGPQPDKMTPEYMTWALQQIVEPIPGVFVPLYMVAAPMSEEDIAYMNAKRVESAPLNAQIIIGQFDQHPQRMTEPQWFLSGAQRLLFDHNGTSFESYQCSDGQWRVLEGERLENARRRTMNLQAPVKAPIPRRRVRRAPVAIEETGEASNHTAHTR